MIGVLVLQGLIVDGTCSCCGKKCRASVAICKECDDELTGTDVVIAWIMRLDTSAIEKLLGL